MEILSRVGLIFLLLTAVACQTAVATHTIHDEGTVRTVDGSFDTTGEVLAAAGVTLFEADEVAPDLNAAADPSTPIQIDRARQVLLKTPQIQQTYRTQQTTLQAFLAEVAVQPQPGQQVVADGRSLSPAQLATAPLPETVVIARQQTVTIIDGAGQTSVQTAAATVGQVLTEAGIRVGGSAQVQPGTDKPVTPNMTITVRRGMPMTIEVDGRIVQTNTNHTSPLDVLAEVGIGLIGFDYTIPGPDAVLQPNSTIQVVRVTEDFRLQDAPIAYQTIWQASDQLDLDTRAVISAGQPGIMRQQVRIRYENGVEVSQTVEGEWVAQEPVNEVIGYGTRIVMGTVDTPQGPRAYWRVVRMRVTSYTAASSGKSPGDPGYGITASGRPAGTGVVAIDRAVVPFRSEVFVPGYGVGFAGDTGGGVRGRWIDLGYDVDEYQSWSGYVDVYYLTPVPPASDINYLLPQGLP